MTVTVNIDIIWLVIGIMIGFLCGGTLLFMLSLGEQWQKGFGDGWSAATERDKKKDVIE